MRIRRNGSLPGFLVQLVVLLAVVGLYLMIVTRGRPTEWLP
jgi:hypothetical protein